MKMPLFVQIDRMTIRKKRFSVHNSPFNHKNWQKSKVEPASSECSFMTKLLRIFKLTFVFNNSALHRGLLRGQSQIRTVGCEDKKED